jgi:hypothetical protein
LKDEKSIDKAIFVLPDMIKIKMLESIAVADLDLLIELISNIEKDHSTLAEHLRFHAQNYNYDYLQQLLNKKETI